jgi:hypothetical protein
MMMDEDFCIAYCDARRICRRLSDASQQSFISTKVTNEEASDFADEIGGFDQSEGEWIRFSAGFSSSKIMAKLEKFTCDFH